jgi:hypothetical protein
MAISRLQPVIILLLVLRAFASLPTQAVARGGRDPSGLSLLFPYVMSGLDTWICTVMGGDDAGWNL